YPQSQTHAPAEAAAGYSFAVGRRAPVRCLGKPGYRLSCGASRAAGFTGAYARRRKRRGMETPDGIPHAYARVAQHVFNLKPVGAGLTAGSICRCEVKK